jgi:hypothetical protein
MFFAIIVLIYFLLIQFFANNIIYDKQKHKYFPYFVSFISLIVLTILRLYCQEIFPDIPNYKEIFDEIPPVSFIINSGFSLDYFDPFIETGFSILISIYKFFSNSFSLFLLLISLFELLVFYIFCNKYKINIVNAIPIYLSFTYLTFQIGMLRQALAFCCFLLALIYINRKIVYFLFLLLGLTMHNSIIFCFLLFWTDKFINRNFLYVLFLISLILYILKIDIINLFLPYLTLGDSNAAYRVGYYMDVDRPNSFLGVGFWDRLLLFIIMNIVYTKLIIKGKINKYNNLIYNLGISVIIVQMIFFSSPTITSRLRYYIVIFPVIFISEYLYSLKRSELNWLKQLIFVCYLFMYLMFQATYLM